MKKIFALLLCVAMCFALGVSAFAGDVVSTDPDTSNPATSNPDTSNPDTSNPDTSNPDSSNPDSSNPDSSNPDSSNPDSSNPDSSVVAIYTDVDSNHVFADEILWCKDNAYMIGYKDGSFKPGQAITRAQVCTVFYRLAKSPAGAPDAGYADADMIAADYVAAVNWAKEAGVMIGYKDNNFRPNQAVTREEFVTVFFRFVKATAGSEDALKDFVDAADVAAVHAPAMCWAVENGIIKGYNDGKILPKGDLTRGAMAAIICRYFTNVDTTTTAVDTTSTAVDTTSTDVESTVISTDLPSTAA